MGCVECVNPFSWVTEFVCMCVCWALLTICTWDEYVVLTLSAGLSGWCECVRVRESSTSEWRKGG